MLCMPKTSRYGRYNALAHPEMQCIALFGLARPFKRHHGAKVTLIWAQHENAVFIPIILPFKWQLAVITIENAH